MFDGCAVPAIAPNMQKESEPMAYPQGVKKLTQIERDLQKYAIEKTATVINDVTQAFSIADQSSSMAHVCVCAVLLRFAATIATFDPSMNKRKWQRICGNIYDHTKEAED